MSGKKETIKEIIKEKDIYPVYQPIVSMQNGGSVVGYEALSRISNADKYQIGIEEMFSIAEKSDMIWELEELCRKKALKGAKQKPSNTKLFINVNPNVITDKNFESGITAKFIKKYGLEPKDIVLEITERSPIKSKSLFQKVLAYYTRQNYAIAIDDFGSAYAGLDRLCYTKSEYLKIDSGLVSGIDKDKTKEILVKHIIQFCRELSIKTIAEGIETENEAEIIRKLGGDYGQGYFYARPEKTFGG